MWRQPWRFFHVHVGDSGKRRKWRNHARGLVGLCVLPGVWLTWGQVHGVGAASMSAIGNEAPIAFAVSPDYARTHMVAAIAVPIGGCQSNCTHLWITRDGGFSWHRAPASAQVPLRITVVRGPGGGERIVGEATAGLVSSDDDGVTWNVVGPAGLPVRAAAFGADAAAVAVPGGHDYLLRSGGRQPVPGSSGADLDVAMVVAQHGDAARYASALLAARDRQSGLPVVLQCDAALSCGFPVSLAGSSPGDGHDISLVLSSDFASSGLAFARTPSGLFRTVDGGRSFLSVAPPPRAAARYTTIPSIAMSAGTLYIALLQVVASGSVQLTAGGVYRSRDLGATWQQLGAGGAPDGGASAVTVTPDGRLFAGYVDGHGDAGLVCSDGGTTWGATCDRAVANCACSVSDVRKASRASTAAPVAAATVPNPAPTDAMTWPTSHHAARPHSAVAGSEHTAWLGPALALLAFALLLVTATVRSRRRRPRLPSSSHRRISAASAAASRQLPPHVPALTSTTDRSSHPTESGSTAPLPGEPRCRS